MIDKKVGWRFWNNKETFPQAASKVLDFGSVIWFLSKKLPRLVTNYNFIVISHSWKLGKSQVQM